MAFKSGIIEVKTLARKLIQVTFEEDIVIDDQFLALTNYAITTSNASANDVAVVAIRGYNTNYSSENHTTSFVNLEISLTTLSALYELNISNLKTANNLTLTGLRGFFTGRNTKFDSVMNFFPQFTDSDFNGIIPNILLAVSGTGEQIGGGEDFGPLPRVVSSASTFGTATFGTDTLGG